MHKKNKKKFKFDIDLMGKQIVVTQEFERNYEGRKRTWNAVNVIERRVGWIVGYSFLCNGIYDSGTPFSYDEDANPPSLRVTEKIPCLLVTFWPNQKPIKIPIDGFLEYDPENNIELKYPYCSSGYGTGVNRVRWIEEHRNFIKRDAKGRFLK